MAATQNSPPEDLLGDEWGGAGLALLWGEAQTQDFNHVTGEPRPSVDRTNDSITWTRHTRPHCKPSRTSKLNATFISGPEIILYVDHVLHDQQK